MGRRPKPILLQTHAKQTDLVFMMRIALTGSRASRPNQTYGTHFFVIINKEKINNTHSGRCQKQASEKKETCGVLKT